MHIPLWIKWINNFCSLNYTLKTYLFLAPIYFSRMWITCESIQRYKQICQRLYFFLIVRQYLSPYPVLINNFFPLTKQMFGDNMVLHFRYMVYYVIFFTIYCI